MNSASFELEPECRLLKNCSYIIQLQSKFIFPNHSESLMDLLVILTLFVWMSLNQVDTKAGKRKDLCGIN